MITKSTYSISEPAPDISPLPLDLRVFGPIFRSRGFCLSFSERFYSPLSGTWMSFSSNTDWSGGEMICSFGWRSNSRLRRSVLVHQGIYFLISLFFFSVCDQTFMKAPVGRALFGCFCMFLGVPYGYLSLMSPKFPSFYFVL